ncbi:Hypothetical predicted protein [Podarcis lilfordi]|uniref:Uncharacterized protein n=1 Tax=Podarcis lilfordi TaxID=74358 RepID=A0AA35L342_9SAUR|nr:Hypothetical predicted protein [Podarcis lilfordi]
MSNRRRPSLPRAPSSRLFFSCHSKPPLPTAPLLSTFCPASPPFPFPRHVTGASDAGRRGALELTLGAELRPGGGGAPGQAGRQAGGQEGRKERARRSGRRRKKKQRRRRRRGYRLVVGATFGGKERP